MTLRRLMTACVITAGIGGAASMVAPAAHAQGAMARKSLIEIIPCAAGISDRRYWLRAEWLWFER